MNRHGSSLDGPNLDGSNLDGSNLEGPNVDGSGLEGPSLDGLNLDSVGACGDWCGKCPHFPHECAGCSSKAGECRFLKCLAGRGLEHCGLCPEFPCQDLISFVPDDRLPGGYHIDSLRHRKQVGTRKWLERYAREWRHLVG